MMMKIIQHVLEHYRKHLEPLPNYNLLIEGILAVTKTILRNYFSTPNLIISMNMGDSVAIKQCLHLQNTLFECLPPTVKL